MTRKYPALVSFFLFYWGVVIGYHFNPLFSLILIPFAFFRNRATLFLIFWTLGSFRIFPVRIAWENLSSIRNKKLSVNLQVLGNRRARLLSLMLRDKTIKTPFILLLRNSPKLPVGTEIIAKGTLRKEQKSKKMLYGVTIDRNDSFFVFKIENWKYKNTKFFSSLKKKLFEIINEVSWNPVNRALLLAFLGGKRELLDPRVKENFRRGGIYHLLALSGLHLGIMGASSEIFFNFLRIPRPYSGILSLILLTLYTFTVGIRPSLLRALLLSFALVLSISLSKKKITLNSIGVSGLLSLLINPLWVFDVGFQLSYTATMGIVVSLPLIKALRCPPILRPLLYSMGISLSANLFTFPLILYYFGKISPLSPITNIFAIPLLSFILSESFLYFLLYFTPLHMQIGALLNFLLYLFSLLLKTLEKVNPPYIVWKPGIITVTLMYFGVIIFITVLNWYWLMVRN